MLINTEDLTRSFEVFIGLRAGTLSDVIVSPFLGHCFGDLSALRPK